MCRRAFSLIEILVVIAIIVIVAGILFAVSASSKERAHVARETEQIRQVFLAVNLYEADYDNVSPRSLVKLNPTYLRPTTLDCPTDERHALHSRDWPANPWVWNVIPGIPSDDPVDVRLRSPFIDSYFYLRPFAGEFAADHTYEQYRNDPSVGLITGVGLLKCVNSKNADAVAGCDYRTKDPVIFPGQPAMNLAGTFLTIRTEGSVKVRHRSQNCLDGTMPISELFFFQTPDCRSSPASGGGSF